MADELSRTTTPQAELFETLCEAFDAGQTETLKAACQRILSGGPNPLHPAATAVLAASKHRGMRQWEALQQAYWLLPNGHADYCAEMLRRHRSGQSMPSVYLTMSEVAAYLQTPKATLMRRLRKGSMRHVQSIISAAERQQPDNALLDRHARRGPARHIRLMAVRELALFIESQGGVRLALAAATDSRST